MIKRILTAVFALTLVLALLAGCTKNDSESAGNSSNGGNANANSGNNNSGNNKNTPAAAPVKYVEGYDFSDGVAWVQTSERQWHCVDKTGKIILQLQQGEKPASVFSHGVALVVRSDRTVELIDKSGKVISSPSSGTYDEICGFIPELGMTLVYKKVVTFQVTEDQVGVIDNQGNWKINLINESTLVGARVSSSDSLMHIRKYIGDGVISTVNYATSYGTTQDSFFNINTGESFSVGYYSNNNATWGSSSIKSMENGYGVFYSGSLSTPDIVGRVSTISSNGQRTEIMANVGFSWYAESSKAVKIGKYKDGLFYYQNDGSTSQFNRVTSYTQGFYNASGNLIINLSGYNINTVPEFADGYCLLSLNNPQGTRFFTIIDKNGREMFEPMLNSSGGFSSLSINCGLVVVRKEDSGYIIINTSGDTVADLGKVSSVSNYNDDAALIKNDGEIYYIDKTGKRLF